MAEFKPGLTEALSCYKHNLQLRIAEHRRQEQLKQPTASSSEASNVQVQDVTSTSCLATPCTVHAGAPAENTEVYSSSLGAFALRHKSYSDWLRDGFTHAYLGRKQIEDLLHKNRHHSTNIYAEIKEIFTTPNLAIMSPDQYSALRTVQKNLLCFIDQNKIPAASDYHFDNYFSLFFFSDLPKEEMRNFLEKTLMPLFEELFLEEPAAGRQALIMQMAKRIQAKFAPYLEGPETIIKRNTNTVTLLNKLRPIINFKISSPYQLAQYERALTSLYFAAGRDTIMRSPQSPAEKRSVLLRSIHAAALESEKESPQKKSAYLSPARPLHHPFSVVPERRYSEETEAALRRAFSQAEPLLNQLKHPNRPLISPAGKIETWLNELNRFTETTETCSTEFKKALKQIHLILTSMAKEQKNRHLLELANKHSNFFNTLSA